MFTQRHYDFLSRFLKYEISVSDTTRAALLHGIVRLLASRLEQDNPKFNRAQFLAQTLGE